MNFFRRIIFPAGLLGSLIVGAGMFSLPYVFAQTGAILGIALIAFFAFVAAAVHVRYAKLVSESGNGDKRFVSLSDEYLGKKWRLPAAFIVIGGITITLSAYLSLSASFANLIVPGMADSAAVFLFWFAGALFIVLGILKYAFIDFLIFVIISGIIGFIGLSGHIVGRSGVIFPGEFSAMAALIAFGPLLFSLSGRSAISSIWEDYRGMKLPKNGFLSAIAAGTAVPAILYLIFVYGVGKLSGVGVSADAVSGITLLGSQAKILIGSLGLFAIITSYVFLGLEFRGILERDFGYMRRAAVMIPAILPIIIYISGLQDFFKLVSIAGGVFLAAESLIVVAMYRAATRRTGLTDVVLAITFIIAIVFEAIMIWR